MTSSNATSYEDVELIIYPDDNGGRLAYEVSIISNSLLGEWHVMVDAKSGEIFEAIDKALYYCNHDHACSSHEHPESTNTLNPISVNGTGFVFDPDPLTLSGLFSGGDFADNNDATNTQLDSARRLAILRDIENFDGIYTLRGPWAEIRDHSPPFKGLFQQHSPDFLFNRSDDAFEAVNVYYHIDSMMRYVNETLNCPVRPSAYISGVRFDPSGANGADVSFYSLGTQQITFGEGCHDDGEDSDIIHHELGHGLHDWLTNGSLSQAEGLSEGFGDYIAQSYNRSLGFWEPTDPQYQWVFNWDGHNDCWAGRVTNTSNTYPSGLGFGLHRDGQIFSTCMMRIYDKLGREKTDKITLEGISMTNGISNQNDAAVAIYTAAQILEYTDEELAIIFTEMTATGYTLPAAAIKPLASFTTNANSEPICPNDSGQGQLSLFDQSSNSPVFWNWSFSGSANPTPTNSTVQNPAVSFSNSGTISASLVVSNSAGSDSTTMEINVALYEDCITDCQTFSSSNLDIEIVGSGVDILHKDTIQVSGMKGRISDVNITNLNVIHDNASDLDASLRSPSVQEVVLLQGNCSNHSDIDVGFDDEAANNITCPLTGGNQVIPLQHLSAFDNSDPNGNWVFTVLDRANFDGGVWNSWEFEICTVETVMQPSDDSADCGDPVTLTGLVIGNEKTVASSITSAQHLFSTATVNYTVSNSVVLEGGFQIDRGAIIDIFVGGCD